MKVIAVAIRNRVFAEGVSMSLRQTDDLRPTCIPGKNKEEVLIELAAAGADILLMDVAPTPQTSGLNSRLEIAREVREKLPGCKIALLCDEVAYPELARDVMRARQNGDVDAFYYTSLTAEYLTASLNAL